MEVAEVDLEIDIELVEERKKGKKRKKINLIKSNNPYLAGGELGSISQLGKFQINQLNSPPAR